MIVNQTKPKFMIRKFTTCLMLYSCFLLSSCKDEKEAPQPNAPTLAVNATTGKANDTEFTFTISEVNADAITLFPYGKDKPKLGTVQLSKSSFIGGVATVKFKYQQVGTFPAVVVANNHTENGNSIKNQLSNQINITITSNKGALSTFTLEFVKDEKTVIAASSVTPDPLTVGNITVTLPYGVDKTKLRAVFQADPFAVVKIGDVVQKSGETVNDFTTSKTYTVVSQDGTVNSSYSVTAVVTAPAVYRGLKSASGKLISKAAKDKAIPAFADSVNNFIVFYDTLGTPANKLDSILVGYTLPDFASIDIKQDALFKAIPSGQGSQKVTVKAQDPAIPPKDYALYAVDAPKLTLSFNGLSPVVMGKTTNFDIELRVLKQTPKSIATTMNIALPAGVTVTSIEADGNVVVSGAVINYTKPVTFKLTVVDSNIGKTYVVTYTATLVQL